MFCLACDQINLVDLIYDTDIITYQGVTPKTFHKKLTKRDG